MADLRLEGDLFAGIPVSDVTRSVQWYARLLGSDPSFRPHDTEAVWELAKHRFVYVVEDADNAGHARHTVFVEDLDPLVQAIAERGIEPVDHATYDNGVRKVTFRDPDGNELGLGGPPTG